LPSRRYRWHSESKDNHKDNTDNNDDNEEEDAIDVNKQDGSYLELGGACHLYLFEMYQNN